METVVSMTATQTETPMESKQRQIFQCTLSKDLQALQQLFEDWEDSEENQDRDQDQDQDQDRDQDWFGETDEAGRNALLIASMAGSTAIVRELITHGARVDVGTVRGYTALHLAACWGHLQTVRTLLELGADPEARTFRGERALDLARKYSRAGCAESLRRAQAQRAPPTPTD
ncbi:unnamed protein product [Menidia menidia]|uniref:(Atlantic silverside) hypothetical protein n=1 Tax=Menidia menidia TaxID=238744 RepID=A0A8S4AS04_9TELE|nr:unnamed protein product [Menidia menidia]